MLSYTGPMVIPPPFLSERAQAVLYAVVTEFINKGEPVGSRTLSAHYGLRLSAATIRGVLKDLEEAGYLSQPHASAGRIPMRAAYQLFIDALMRVSDLGTEAEARIVELFQSHADGTQLLRECGRLLSDLSGVPAVIVQTRSEARKVKKIRFILTRPGELLSVIVLDDDSVENRFITVERALPPEQLERVHLLLDEVTSGRTLRALRLHLEEVAEVEQGEVGALRQLSDGLLGSALRQVEKSTEVIVEGRSNLLRGGDDPERMRHLLVALEDRKQLMELLDRAVAAERVQVFLGSDGGLDGSPLSVVAASYRGPSSGTLGALGVLGPHRMDYPRLVPLVGAMAQAMTRSLDDPGRK